GQTGLNLADALAEGGVRILGSSVDTIDLAEDRRRCEALLRNSGIPQSPGGSPTTVEEALQLAAPVGYPVPMRPSYGLGWPRRAVASPPLIARLVKAVGLINIQFVIQDGVPHVLEVNPRASRTVPFLSKVTGVPMVRLATLAALGKSLSEQGFGGGLRPARPL